MTDLLFPELRSARAAAGVSRGVLVRWLVADGSDVRAGRPLAEVRAGETAGRVHAPAGGTLWRLAEEGEVLMPGNPVGLIE